MQETLVPRVNRHVQVEGAFVLVQDIISSKTVEAELVSHRNHFVDVVAAHTRDLVAAKDAAAAVNVAKSEFFWLSCRMSCARPCLRSPASRKWAWTARSMRHGTNRAGYKNVQWMRGGFPEWKSRGFPVD